MGKDGETYIAMVSYSVVHGKLAEYYSNGALIWGNNGH